MNTPVALITGASRGLGRALAAGLAREGFALIIDARNGAALGEVAAPLRAAGATVTAISGDITDPAHRDALLQAAQTAGGQVPPTVHRVLVSRHIVLLNPRGKRFPKPPEERCRQRRHRIGSLR